MVKRSKRSLPPGKAAEMKAAVQSFHWEVRKWCGEIPLGTTVYVALEGLNDALGTSIGSRVAFHRCKLIYTCIYNQSNRQGP